VGRKASGPAMMGSGVAQPAMNCMIKPILSLGRWVFYVGDWLC
jgi:hypothetical protein